MLIPYYSLPVLKGDGEQRPLSDPPGDILAINATFVITGSKGAVVRDSLDSESQELMTLPSGTCVCVCVCVCMRVCVCVCVCVCTK